MTPAAVTHQVGGDDTIVSGSLADRFAAQSALLLVGWKRHEIDGFCVIHNRYDTEDVQRLAGCCNATR
jgi:hypothetical protein